MHKCIYAFMHKEEIIVSGIISLVVIPVLFIPSILAFILGKEKPGKILLSNIVIAYVAIAREGMSFWMAVIAVFILFIKVMISDEKSYVSTDRNSSEMSVYLRNCGIKVQCPNCKQEIDCDYTSCPKCAVKFNKEIIDKNAELLSKTRRKRERIEDGKWVCRSCETKNNKSKISCSVCGNYR